MARQVRQTALNGAEVSALCESAGIGRQARLRGVCQPTWEFKSPLSHQNNSSSVWRGCYFYSYRDLNSRGLLETCRWHVSTRGGPAPQRGFKSPLSHHRRRKLCIACDGFFMRPYTKAGAPGLTQVPQLLIQNLGFRCQSFRSGVMLSRLITSVDALCSSADVAGGSRPATPRQISIRLKPIIRR